MKTTQINEHNNTVDIIINALKTWVCEVGQTQDVPAKIDLAS